MTRAEVIIVGLALFLVLVVTVRSSIRRERQHPIQTPITVPELIDDLTESLRRSEQARINDGLPALFELNSAEVEIAFEVERSSTTEGGISLKAISATAGDTEGQKHAHRLRLVLSPVAVRSGVVAPGEGE